jgi:hypothetical protein
LRRVTKIESFPVAIIFRNATKQQPQITKACTTKQHNPQKMQKTKTQENIEEFVYAWCCI